MADVSIANTVVQAVPEDYPIGGPQVLLLKAVRGRFDGTNSSQDYLPAVQAITTNGVVAWTAVTRATITAGGLADVSFFPTG